MSVSFPPHHACILSLGVLFLCECVLLNFLSVNTKGSNFLAYIDSRLCCSAWAKVSMEMQISKVQKTALITNVRQLKTICASLDLMQIITNFTTSSFPRRQLPHGDTSECGRHFVHV